MILSVAVILGLLASIVRHRREAASEIASLPLRLPWLALIALALQLPLLRAPLAPAEQVVAARNLFLLSHLLLLLFVWLNRRLVGVQIIGVGVLCNLLAILVNGGFMPIAPETLARINPGTALDQWTLGFHYGGSKDIILLKQDTILWALSDILVVPPPFPWPAAFSLGDLMIALGIVILLQGPILLPGRAHSERRSQGPNGLHAHLALSKEGSIHESQES